jgi:tRNA pseudouridine38-40 synthase
MLEFHIEANRFLHGMVRALVGTMVDVGRGYTPREAFQEILEARNRNAAGMSAPSRGLFLEEVLY